MKRLWAVRPDHTIPTAAGDLPAVSREAMRDAMLDAESILARAGGVITVIVGRAPTGLEGESATTGAIFEWKHRTDAKTQPEEHGEVVPAEPWDEAESPEDEPRDVSRWEQHVDQAAGQLGWADGRRRGAAAGAEPDDEPLKLEEEDLSSIPAEQR